MEASQSQVPNPPAPSREPEPVEATEPEPVEESVEDSVEDTENPAPTTENPTNEDLALVAGLCRANASPGALRVANYIDRQLEWSKEKDEESVEENDE